MAIDFPNSPTTGQVFAPGTGVIYQWNGTLWLAIGASGGGGGDFWATTSGTISSTTSFTTVTGVPALTGNLGGWYVPATGRYTPPAGRYCIFAQVDSGLGTGAVMTTLILRKNGATILRSIETPGAANWFNTNKLMANVDANGTDYFDVQIQCNAASTIAQDFSFGAFPIPAAGTTSVPSTSWRQLARVVPTAGQATVDFQNVPTDINELMFAIGNVVPQTNDVDLYLRFFDNTGTIDAGTNYFWGVVQNLTSAASGGNALFFNGGTGGQSAIVMGNATASARCSSNAALGGFNGNGKVHNIKDTTRKFVEFQNDFADQGGTALRFMSGNGARAVSGAITGLRFLWGSGNFAAGGAVTLWGSP